MRAVAVAGQHRVDNRSSVGARESDGVSTSDTPLSVAEIMNPVGVWWAVAGGWAIDLWLGEQTRDHHDIEVVVRRSDQAAVHAALEHRLELYCIDPPRTGWRPWTGGPIEPPAFQVQARSPTTEFDLFAETADQTMWHFRRDERITRPVTDVTMYSASGIPVVDRRSSSSTWRRVWRPRTSMTSKWQAFPGWTTTAASWLADALTITLPDHRWIRDLR